MQQIGKEETFAQSYFGLRLGMIALTLLLFASIVIQYISLGCLQSSISSYYYTPVRPIFVLALGAIGACLIVYRAQTSRENVVLDVAGFTAVIVALVPTGSSASGGGCVLTNVPMDGEIQAAVTNNVGALFATGLAAILLGMLLKPRYIDTGKPIDASRIPSIVLCVALLAGGTVYFLANPTSFARHAHLAAAALFFGLVLAAIGLNASRASQPYSGRYWAIFGVTLLIGLPLLIWGIVGDAFRTWLFWVEAIGIAGFAAFWVVQTQEMGGFPDRNDHASESARVENESRV